MTALLPALPFYIYLALFAPITVFVFAVIWKWFEVRGARQWPSVPGKVVASAEELRPVRVLERKTKRSLGFRYEERTFANIVYKYEVAGQLYTNNRVTIGEDRGNYEVAETIERYPVGRAVTVYYDPDRMSESVLERDLPGMWRIAGCMVAAYVILMLGSLVSFKRLAQFASAHVANAPLTVAIGAAGTVMALVAASIQRHARQARHWPIVQGTVITSGLEAFRTPEAGRASGPVRVHAHIGYTYLFNDKRYSGSVIAMKGHVGSASDGALRRWTNRYRDGQIVDVYVNPAKPAESVLEPRAPGIWAMWAISALLLSMAAFVATRGP